MGFSAPVLIFVFYYGVVSVLLLQYERRVKGIVCPKVRFHPFTSTVLTEDLVAFANPHQPSGGKEVGHTVAQVSNKRGNSQRRSVLPVWCPPSFWKTQH